VNAGRSAAGGRGASGRRATAGHDAVAAATVRAPSRAARPPGAVAGPAAGARALRRALPVRCPRLVPDELAWLGAALVLLAAVGAGLRVETLATAVVATLVATGVSLARRRPFRLLLIDVWAVAFAYLYASDLALTKEGVLATFGPDVTLEAEAFLVASFGASLLGAAWLDRHAATRRAPRSGASWREVHPARLRPSPGLAGLVLLTTAMVLVFVFWVITPAQLFATARVERSFSDTATRPLLIAAVVLQPILAAYVTRRYRVRGPVVWAAWLVAPLSALALYASGTRFYLGFMLCGVLHYVLEPLRPMSRRRRLAIAAAALAFLALQGTMRASRGSGLVHLDAGEIAASLVRPETFLSSEGLLRVNAWVHEKRAWESTGRPFENAFILYWWVPRSIWPDKPAMEGRRLIDDVMDDGWFGANHSVAGGFAMPALLDFGPWLGTVAAFLYGVALGALQRFAWRHASLFDPASVVVALALFGVFFTARGLHTSLIFVSLCLLWALPVLLVERRRARRSIALPAPAATARTRRAYA